MRGGEDLGCREHPIPIQCQYVKAGEDPKTHSPPQVAGAEVCSQGFP